ncbi:hypothetical protein MmiHf6_10210 [Methanimicrococcus hongohii]|uniref:Uncharacterized protein n=1 Tax=Methanimicrococcus hongohii TaxID=3028295 RepID=A0AA96ZUF2_9EURY|nr:hypothetical protein [Methanimicrococcus sp. Hf6]WNY23707.1 hypothetical protein MmiHf6_10210 [Methanimicrococcus sp. Hf6]
MVQTEAAMEAYNEMWAGIVPAADITWMIFIIIIGIAALYMARRFVTEF